VLQAKKSWLKQSNSRLNPFEVREVLQECFTKLSY
jgi:hypothetical protein